MRARNIKPGFFQNEDLVECSFGARLLFIGLWCLADREGRLEDRPKKIKMEIFPADNVDCDALLDELKKYNFIIRYEAEGGRYIEVVNFAKHQKPHIRESESEIPPRQAMSGKNKTCGSTLEGHSTNHGSALAVPNTDLGSDEPSPRRPDSLNPDSLNPESITPPPTPPPHGGTTRPKKLPDDFAVTDDMAAWFAKQGFRIDITAATEQFIDHWRGTGKPMKDWTATWRNSMRKQNQWAGNGRHGPRKGTTVEHNGRLVSRAGLVAAKACEQAYRELYGEDEDNERPPESPFGRHDIDGG